MSALPPESAPSKLWQSWRWDKQIRMVVLGMAFWGLRVAVSTRLELLVQGRHQGCLLAVSFWLHLPFWAGKGKACRAVFAAPHSPVIDSRGSIKPQESGGEQLARGADPHHGPLHGTRGSVPPGTSLYPGRSEGIIWLPAQRSRIWIPIPDKEVCSPAWVTESWGAERPRVWQGIEPSQVENSESVKKNISQQWNTHNLSLSSYENTEHFLCLFRYFTSCLVSLTLWAPGQRAFVPKVLLLPSEARQMSPASLGQHDGQDP